eukprot:TRINITY_DN41839_c0_g2_i2.p1 TRINITY_DN41839_c0_g2~~TRINITY_DN41839_c0_g2_i2.p1  ORF type:complete len:129 (+),score=41.63 TRINITY_DN41839_c0_g2_i2:1-387(+)
MDMAMSSYEASCGSQDWFFEVDLGRAVATGLWELLARLPNFPCRCPKALEAVVATRYDAAMDEFLQAAVMNEAVVTMLANEEEEIREKAARVLWKAREGALNASAFVDSGDDADERPEGREGTLHASY